MASAHELMTVAAQHHQSGRLAAAEAGYRQVLVAEPDHPDALHLLGLVMLQSGRRNEAIGLIKRAMQVRPSFPEAVNNLGVILDDGGDLAEAERLYRQALSLKLGYVDALNNLGGLLQKQSRMIESADAFREASRLRPGDLTAGRGLGFALLEQGNLDEAIRVHRELRDRHPDSPKAHSDLLYWLLHDPDQTAESLLAEHVAWAERFERPLLAAAKPHTRRPDPRGPLRVGYVSPDFREHTVARFVEPFLTRHDRMRVTAVCYSDVAHPDETTRRIRAAVPEWRDTAGMSDEDLAALIRRDEIDILVDLTGHMGGNRLLVFARKPAPLQVSYGYPHSTGLSSIDYWITDEIANPPGNTERYFTERLIHLHCAWCYRPHGDDADEAAMSPVFPSPPTETGTVTFGCLNKPAKINRTVARLWAAVLAAVPGSRLLAAASGGDDPSKNLLRGRFEQWGLPGDRLSVFDKAADRREYLERFWQIDVCLDPFPLNGITTT